MSLVSSARRTAIRAALLFFFLFRGPAEPAEPQDVSPEEPVAEIAESLTVTDTRLRDQPADRRRVPAHVSIMEGEEILSRGAATVQEVLSGSASVISYDQVGNDLSRVLDLRGFAGGGLKVFLNGVPLNEPRNNALQLELVPPEALDRLEISRGPNAATFGGGAASGVINLWTRRGGGRGGRIALSTGEDSTHEGSGSVWTRGERWDLSFSGSRLETDGHRQNAASDLTRAALVAGWASRGDSRLELSLVRGSGDFGNPGALTLPELVADREQAPFNALDFTDESSLQAALGFQGVAEQWSLTASVYSREREADILTTGRAAPTFGGFFTTSDTSLVGAAAQANRPWSDHDVTIGVELLDGDTEVHGFSTSPQELARIDPAFLSSENVAKRRTTAAFVSDSWSPAETWTLSLGARLDDEEIAYRESFPNPANDDELSFSEISVRAGVVWLPAESWELYAAYGESFLPPTVEELFSFPGFGSNPDLRPEDSDSIELGARWRWRNAALDAALFRIDTVDEIVFDPSSPLSPFGANENAGETRRKGLEVVASGDGAKRVRWSAALTLTEAEFSSGPGAGRTVPLVPDERLALGVDLALPHRFDLHGRMLYVGEQTLAGDEANIQPPLSAYTLLGSRLTWRAREGATGPRLFLEIENLLDEEYSTRGIYAFDFSTFQNDTFFTPAPGRRVFSGVEWRF